MEPSRFAILDVMKRKIPVLILTIHTLIVNTFYKTCEVSDKAKTGFMIYYPLLCLACLVWEAVHAYRASVKLYSHKSTKNHLWFSVLAASTSLFAFVGYSYYVEGGRPFSCVFNYNDTVAIIVLAVSFLLVTSISCIEHFYWGKIKSFLPLDIDGYENTPRSYRIYNDDDDNPFDNSL